MSDLVPIAEHFHSLQGEGWFVGTPMHFIRLAGCSVGAKATRDFKAVVAPDAPFPMLAEGVPASMCQTYDQRFFVCDTDFRLKDKISYLQLVEETYEKHICLTGGEPLNHQDSAWWNPFMHLCAKKNIKVHFETSGTVRFNNFLYNTFWVVCSPKKNFIPDFLYSEADEVRFLVDDDFDETRIPKVGPECKVFLSPINDEHTVIQPNLQRCIEILARHPGWRLSVQLHKYLGLR
jgi:7-carboxy-7-deazaguanine synthase